MYVVIFLVKFKWGEPNVVYRVNFFLVKFSGECLWLRLYPPLPLPFNLILTSTLPEVGLDDLKGFFSCFLFEFSNSNMCYGFTNRHR